MKLLLSSITAAALALVASASPILVTREVTTELPARFAMYLVTDEARANGMRIQYANSEYPFLSIETNPAAEGSN